MPTRRAFIASLATGAAALTLAPTAFAQTQRTGSFTGASNHVTTGTGGIVEQNGKFYVALGEDFTFDGAPDPKVALGKDGYDKSTLMGLLKSNTGAQSYEIPAGINPAEFNEIWIWCERFNVPLGVAKLGS